MGPVFRLVLWMVVCNMVNSQLRDGNLSQEFLRIDPTKLESETPAKPCAVNYSCLNCTMVRVCGPTEDRRGLQEIRRFTCPSATEWCDPVSATCVAEQPAQCLIPATGQFHCMRDGNFPNINDCSNYFHCKDGNPYVFKCVIPKRYYNPVLEACHTSTTCANNRVCEGKNGVRIKIAESKNLFAYCANGTVVTLDRCVGAYEFNVKTQVCEPTCPHPGLFPSSEDCGEYYKCTPPFKTATTFNITQHACPPGQGFLQEEFQCVNRTLVPNCNVASPSIMAKK